jgi:nucleotide-binding universal stress UspA family protein
MFERLLLAIDDSPASEMATLFATAFAQRSGASVHVLHVNEYLVADRDVTVLTRAEATELVTDAVTHLHAAGVRASGSVVAASYRHVPNRIIAMAADRGADAIVLGSHRKRRLGRLFSPQVRERTTRMTALPVLTAPSPLKVSRGAFDLSALESLQSELTLQALPQ